LVSGGATPTTSGTGITFPASASASTNANTSDDYEEGTWTPTVVPASGYCYTFCSTWFLYKDRKSCLVLQLFVLVVQ
jgi:hypothetical protein